jgi:hypothetical protein
MVRLLENERGITVTVHSIDARAFAGTPDRAPLKIVQTWDNGKFEEIDLTKWVQSSPRYLLANNFTGVPETTITRLKQA